eukprot:g18540.t1
MTGHQAGRPRVLRGFPTQEGTWKPVLEESEARRKLKAKPWKLCGRSCPAAWEQAAEVWDEHELQREWEQVGLRSVLTGAVNKEPVKVDFEDKQGKYSVSIHFACHFHALRHWICGDDLNFVRSLHRCNKTSMSGGKTGASFYSSHDDRFLLEALNKPEFDKLVMEANSLFWYFDKVLFEKLPSVLTQVIGLFTVFTSQEWTSGKPLYLAQEDLSYLEAAMFNDTTLLSTLYLMDYSLLLAAVPPEGPPNSGRLSMGIIDYLRAYTVDKKLESAVKTLRCTTQMHFER